MEDDFDPFSDASALFGVFLEDTAGAQDAQVLQDKRRRESGAPDYIVRPGGVEKRLKAPSQDDEDDEEVELNLDQMDVAVERVQVPAFDSERPFPEAPAAFENAGAEDEDGEGEGVQAGIQSDGVNSEIGRVTHSVCVPKGVEVTAEMRNPSYPPPNPAREYPFSLDPFQKMSIAVLERQESVLVSAHTSAGKTVVAEYAIAMGLRDQQRVVYTSPLKALSNQKFRELDEIFGDVGLMTGDVTLNPTASCIVMTTEILRSMLYRGSEVMREVGTVIFDEIHYMRDQERGVVWEETIILLPQKVKYVFLSATIPNSEEFASWIAATHQQTCHVVYTDVRPVPLQHYLFPAGGSGLHLVVDDKGKFREGNFQKAIAGVLTKQTGGRVGATKQAGQSDIFKIIEMIVAKNYEPVIVFAFSKRDCESLAMQMGKLSFTTDDEKKITRQIFANAIEPLSEDDKQLPQIQHLLPLLQKGIGIHHSGLLPLIKEVIEILFQEGLLKCLFATETFAMGLNMPAHTAVFSSVRKFDGKEMRWVSGGEYVQMSGRAGRRGKDDRGIVILMVDEKMEPEVAKGMLKGSTQPLMSAFHITYSMLLNLMRVEGLKPEMLINSSFAAFQKLRSVPQLQRGVDELRSEMSKHTEALESTDMLENASAARELVHVRAKLETLREEFCEIVLHPLYALPYLQPGRLLQTAGADPQWGVCIAFQKTGASGSRADYMVDVLMSNSEGDWVVTALRMTSLGAISSLRVPLPADLRPSDSRRAMGRKLDAIQTRFQPHGPPLLDPVEDMNIRNNALLDRCVQRIAALETVISDAKFSSEAVQSLIGHAMEEAVLEKELRGKEAELKVSKHAYLSGDLKKMHRVLRRLQFTTEENGIDVKGRIACELQTSHELLLVEMLFNGLFNDMQPPIVAALLSCFAFDADRSSKDKDLTAQVPPLLLKELGGPLRTMQSLARRVATVMMECKIEISPDEYVQRFSPGMANVVYEWAKGARFLDICKLSAAFEGHIVRSMRRLEELLRQMMQCSRAIGNADLEQKFGAAIMLIKRDIVFSSSLYL